MATELQLSSPAFTDHDVMPERLSRPGGNVSPPLEWTGVPDGTRELMLLCEDPDASPEPFLHWLVTGIDPATRAVGEGETPASGQEWSNGFGGTGWGGPQPPVGGGQHRYIFRLYAMAEPPELPPRPGAADVRHAAEDHAIAGGNLVGRFAR